MPDHLHVLIAPKAKSLITLINAWKSYSANLLHRMGLRGPVWQRSFYDRALRSEESVAQAAEYVIANPVRKGLVAEWTQYPYVWAYWLQDP